MSGDASQHPAPGTASGPKTSRGRASRERLVEAAVASVTEHGIKQLRLDEVLSSAGSSKSQMYHYFSDRDALIDAAVAHRCEEFLGQLGVPPQQFVAFLDQLQAQNGNGPPEQQEQEAPVG